MAPYERVHLIDDDCSILEELAFEKEAAIIMSLNNNELELDENAASNLLTDIPLDKLEIEESTSTLEELAFENEAAASNNKQDKNEESTTLLTEIPLDKLELEESTSTLETEAETISSFDESSALWSLESSLSSLSALSSSSSNDEKNEQRQPQRKSVTFASEETLTTTHTITNIINQLTMEEIENLYLTRNDIRTIQRNNRRTLKDMRVGYMPDDDTYYFRGLESQLETAKRERLQRVTKVLRCVLDEQESSGYLSPEWVESVYSEHTIRSEEIARMLALIDEESVRRIG